MPRIEHLSQSEDATRRLGRRLAGVLRPGDVVALHGALGAGKTALVRCVAEAMGVPGGLVSSPTFVVVNQYPLSGGAELVHVDAYRLTSGEELDEIGWDALVGGSSVVLVEWAERVAEALPEDAASITMEHAGETARRIVIELPEAWAGREGLDALLAEGGGGALNPDEAGQDEVGEDERVAEGRVPAEERTATRCPVTGVEVPADSPTWPFADERARMADLYRWFSGQYGTSRDLSEDDLE